MRYGVHQWRRCEITYGVGGDADPISVIEAAIEDAVENPNETLLRLQISGTTDLAGRRRIEDSLNIWEARLRYLRRRLKELVDEPSADDLDAIDKSGFVRAAVDELKTMADDPTNQRQDIARTALRILYFEHIAAGN